jgi:PAS domain S-box-containing protein
MVLLRDLIELIVEPPGDMVYHLVTLFAIQLILGVAFGHWNRNRRDLAAIRLLVLGAGCFLARVLLILIAGLVRIGALSPNVVPPPLERFLDLATLLLAAWTFLPILARHSRLDVAMLILSLVIAAGVYIAFGVRWPQVEAQSILYNDYWQAAVWELFSIAVLTLAIIVGVIWREEDWSLVTCMFALWLAGHILQLSIPPLIDSHTAGWVRLSNLAALPLVASLVYRRALSASPDLAPRTDEIAGLEVISIVGAAQRIETAQDVEAALRMAAPSIAHALGADMVAIGLPTSARPGSPESEGAKKIRIVALHPSTGTMLANQEPSLLLSRHPLLVTAIKTGSLQRAREPSKDPTIIDLYRRLGFEQAGPLLALPLVNEGAWLGIILTGNPTSQQSWTARSRQIFQAAGSAITRAMVNAARREVAAPSVDSQQALSEARRLAQRTMELEAALAQQRQRAEELATKLRLREQKSAAESDLATEAALWQEEMQSLTDARTAAEVELAEWKEKARQLAQSEEDLQAQLVQAQAELEQAQSQAASLAPPGQPIRYSPIPRGFLIGDEQGNIIVANQGARTMIGQFSTELEGTPLPSLFTEPSWVETANRFLQEETQDNETATVILNLDGRLIRAELTRVPSIAGGTGTLAVMFYPAEGTAQQDDVVTSLIHELRTPMTSITGYIDLLLGESVGILGETQRQLLHRVNANIERMGGLLEDLVKFSSVDTSPIALSPEPVDLIRIIEDAIVSLSTQFREYNVGIQMDMPSELPPIQADPDSLYQIVLRLLSNACQCSIPGTKVTVRARLEEYDTQMDDLPDYLFMSVTDTGGGIAPRDQQRVFQRLYRADNPLIEGVGDTGVGLSIAKALVEMQGGRIWAESEAGVGSVFSFILPLSPENSDDRLSEHPSSRSSRVIEGELEVEQ